VPFFIRHPLPAVLEDFLVPLPPWRLCPHLKYDIKKYKIEDAVKR